MTVFVEIRMLKNAPAIVGSVPSYTPIIAKDSKGFIDIKPISEIALFKTEEYEISKPLEPLWIITPHSNQPRWNCWSKIQTVSRFPFYGQLIRLNTRGGVVDVSDNHSVIMGGKSGGRQANAGSLKIGDYLSMPQINANIGGYRGQSAFFRGGEDLAWLFGFFVAEGSAHIGRVYHVSIANQSRLLLKRSKEIFEKSFEGIQGSITSDKVCLYLRFSNKGMTHFFNRFFYTTQKEKKVPKEILNAPKNVQQAFIQGFYDGDGSLSKKGHRSFANKSQILIMGIIYLLQSTTKQAWSISHRYKRHKVCYDVKVNRGSQNRDSKREIISISRFPYEGFLYDIQTKNGKFTGGIGPIGLHNTDMRVYGPFVKDRVYAIPKENARSFLKLGLAVATRREAEKPTLKQMFQGEVLNGYVEATKIKQLGSNPGFHWRDWSTWKSLLWDKWVKTVGTEKINMKSIELHNLYQWFVRACDLAGLDPDEVDVVAYVVPQMNYENAKKVLDTFLKTPPSEDEYSSMYEEYKQGLQEDVRTKFPEAFADLDKQIAKLERETASLPRLEREKERYKRLNEQLQYQLEETKRRVEEERKALEKEVSPIKIRVLKSFSEGIMDYVAGQVVETRNVDWVLDKVQKGFATRVGIEVAVTPPPKELTEDEQKRLMDVFKAVLFKELGKVPANALAVFRVELERVKIMPYEEAKKAVEGLAEGIITAETWRKRVKVAKPPPPRERVTRVGFPPEREEMPVVFGRIPPAYPPSEPDTTAVPFPRAPSSRERVEFEKAFRYRLQEQGMSYMEYLKQFEDYVAHTVFKSWKHMLESYELVVDAILKGQRLPPLSLWKGVPVPYGLRPLLRAEPEITETYETMPEAEKARDLGRRDYEFVRIEPEPEITVVWRSTKPFRELIEPVQYNSIVKAATVVLKNAKFFRKPPTLKDIIVKLEEEFGIIATEQDIKDIVADAWKNKELLPVPWFTTITLEELDELFK